MWGRLQPGQNPKAAEEELRSLAAELRRQHPTAIWEDERLPSEPGAYASSSLIGNRRGTGTEQRDPVVPIFALVGTLTLLILAVACGNLGSMLLARGVARQREIAIRVAIGAGNGRLIRQLFTESLLLAMLGSLAGLAVGYVVLRGLLVVAGGPAWLDASPDWRVVVFALAAGFGSAILFGLTPALQVGRQHHRAIFTRQVLIGAQVAASCVLMIVAGLLGRALDHAASTDPGFEYRQVVSIDPGLGEVQRFSGQGAGLSGRAAGSVAGPAGRPGDIAGDQSAAGSRDDQCRNRCGRTSGVYAAQSRGSPVFRDDEDPAAARTQFETRRNTRRRHQRIHGPYGLAGAGCAGEELHPGAADYGGWNLWQRTAGEIWRFGFHAGVLTHRAGRSNGVERSGEDGGIAAGSGSSCHGGGPVAGRRHNPRGQTPEHQLSY